MPGRRLLLSSALSLLGLLAGLELLSPTSPEARASLCLHGQALAQARNTPARTQKSPRTLSLDVREADIGNVFRMIAQVSEQNIVVSERVQGKVTLRLVNVPWTDALQAVLFSHQLGMVQLGNILQIDTLEALKQTAEASAKLAKVSAGTPETRMFVLQNAVASDLKSVVEGMLSPEGKLSVDTRTNTLIVTDTPERLHKLETLLYGIQP